MSNLYINGHFLHQRLTGVQRYAAEVIKGFDRAGYPYQIIEPTGRFSSNKLSQQLWEQLVLPRRKKRDDVLWSPTNSGPLLASNHVITLHDIGVFPHPEWFSPMYVRWKRLLIPPMARRARGILTVSEFSKKVICRYLSVSPGKVMVVYNGVDTSRFKVPPPGCTAKVKDKYSITKPYFLALGSLDPRKNFSRLLEAWKRCTDEEHLSNYELVIAGGSNTNFRQFQINESSSNVRFIGYVDDRDLPSLYSGATAFLFPSLFEGFGLPVIEAMACQTPVLTSDTTALREIAGDAALKVNPRSVTDIKEGIMKLADSTSLRDDLKKSGLKNAKRFNWDRSAQAIYRYLVG